MHRALVAEDDARTRASLVSLLEARGCVVDAAENGELAVGLLTRERYDVVLLDIVLPKISGTEIMEHLLCTQPEVLSNVIVVTGLDVREIRKLFPDVCDTLAKPVVPQRLYRAVRDCLTRADSGASGNSRGIARGCA